MDNLYGRDKEQKQLSEVVQSDKAELLAIYGRRRVGKTYLVRQFFDDKFDFYVSGVLNGTPDEQLSVFRHALEQYGLPESKASTWLEAFYELESLLEDKVREHKPCVLFIDELPCFDTPKARFIPAFDHFWNAWASRFANVKLIVCGSATSWMMDELINARGGLHNRLTSQMYLAPFTLQETKEYLQQRGFVWDNRMIVDAYMALGGIPFYLSLIKKQESFPQAIDRLYFAPKAPLEQEYDRLFASLFKSPAPYLNIIEALSRTKEGLSRDQIAEKTKIKTGGRLTALLDDLVNCDFVRVYHCKAKSGISKKDSFYALSDLFCLFHLHFNKKKNTNPQFWQQHLNTPTLNSWGGLAFEQVVMQHVDQVKRALGITGIAVEYYAWRSKQTTPKSQIDLILDRADRLLNICEIKYSQGIYTISEAEETRLLIRQQNFRLETGLKQGFHLTMITPYGINRNSHCANVTSVITLNDLFA